MKKIVTLSALSLGVLFLAGCGQQPVGQTQQTTPTPVAQTPVQPVATQSVDDTIDWKEYSSTNFGISFKYPSDYIFMDRTSSSEKSILLGDKNFPNPDIAPSYHAPITISKYDENLLNDQVSALSNVKKNTLTVDGQNANVVEGNYQNYPAPGIPADKHMRIITVPSKNITILSQDSYAGAESDWNEITSVISKLLTTIKFTK